MSAQSEVSLAEFNEYIYSSTTQTNLVQIILNAPYKNQLMLEYLRLTESAKDKLVEFLGQNLQSRHLSVAEVVNYRDFVACSFINV
jgi:hypothetical protein